MKVWNFIGAMPSTNVRITVTLILATATGVRVIALGWAPPTEWLAFLAGMGFIDAGQFVGKRITQHPEPTPPEG